MAGCAAVLEVPASDNADNRAVWIDFQAILPDGATICQYYGRSCNDFGFGGGNLRDSKVGTGDKWFNDLHYTAVWSVHGLPGAAGGIHTGVCVYNAFFSIYRPLPTGTLKCITTK